MTKQNEYSKKNYIPLLIGVILCILSAVLLSYGYSAKAESSVTAEDVSIVFGFITCLIGIILLIYGGILILGKKNPSAVTVNERVQLMTQAALLTALCYIGFQFFKISIPVGTEKTAFHLGNTFCVLAALLIGGFWGGMAGSIGMSIADLTSSYVTSAPKTFLLKLCIGLIVGLVAHKLFHISQEKSKAKVVKNALIASICGMGFNVVADPVVGYFYKRFLLGIPQDAALVWAKIGTATTLVNAVVAVIVSVIIYTAVRPALKSAGLYHEVK